MKVAVVEGGGGGGEGGGVVALRNLGNPLEAGVERVES